MEPFNSEVIFDASFALLWIFATLAICHCVISAAGLHFCEAEILKIGNEELLDSLDEGLLIVGKDDVSNIIFLNKSARSFEYVSSK